MTYTQLQTQVYETEIPDVQELLHVQKGCSNIRATPGIFAGVPQRVRTFRVRRCGRRDVTDPDSGSLTDWVVNQLGELPVVPLVQTCLGLRWYKQVTVTALHCY
ncbi:hypothetical protein J6590_082306 [Homalodisca vitripennis]|nr:hypothetical protein J6590_082306 [Homalodisca vitripennis]